MSHSLSRAQQMLTCVAIAGSALVVSSCSSEPASDDAGAADPEIITVAKPPAVAAPSAGRVAPQSSDLSTDDGEYDSAFGTREELEVEVNGITKSITDPDSLWILVNKINPLPRTYEPTDLVIPDMPRKGEHVQLRAEAARALTQMSKAANIEVGKPIQLVSGYRSYPDQKEVYNRYVAKDGQEAADTYSARAGYSEHQTGLVADLSTVHGKMEKFGDTKVGQWAAENCWKYGFILRYTPENHNTVGYQAEPWHFRYVGLELATYMHDNEMTSLEQALNQTAAPNYQSR